MGKKILVVDNHPLILKLMSAFLIKEGHEVLTAEDGLSALEILQGFVPDFIFVDLIMPRIGGEKLCRTIRALPGLENVRIIILSAITAEKDFNLRELGADGCIAKRPFAEVAKNVAALLLELDGERKSPATKILGREAIYPREITKELLSSTKHFETIINNMVEGVLEITNEGRIIFVNSTAATLLGISEEKLLAVDFPELFDGVHRERVVGLLAGTVKGPQFASEDYPLLLNGRRLTLQLLPLEGEKKAGTVIVIFRDVTERKQMEDHFRRTQKLEAIGTLAGGIAHDLNNILQPVLGYAQLTLKGLPGESEHRDYLEQIVISVMRAADLISQILAFSRHSEPERRPVHLASLVREVAKLLRGVLPCTIEIREEILSGSGFVLADEGQIHQVIMNLATNSYHAMRQKGGVLTLGLEEIREPLAPTSRDEPTAETAHLRLTVTDTGHGMTRGIKERIFEPYFTTKDLGEGTGLGLAMVLGIVNSHGGGIGVYSIPGQGTRFEVSLPMVAGEDGAGKEQGEPDRHLIKARVLLVDDEGAILRLGQRTLEHFGCSVSAFKDSREAWQAFAADPDEFDLVITDQLMPHLTGTALARKILNRRPEMPILLVTGFSETINDQVVQSLGIRELLMKPFAIDELATVLKRLLEPADQVVGGRNQSAS